MNEEGLEMRRPTKKLIEPLPVALARRKERQIDVASGTLQVIAHRAFVHARNCAWAGMLNRGTDALFPRQGESHSVHVRYDLGSGFEGDGTGGFAWGGLDGYIDAVGRLLSFDETHAVSWRAWFAITAVPDPGRLLQHTCPQAGAHAANARRTIKRATAGGDANPNLDPEDEAAALASFIDGLGLHALISPEAFTPAERGSLLEGFCSRWRVGAQKRSARHA
ncbi:hypothetical protein ACVIGB_010110 [Bradyrhizobium sp. USDA 4341]